MKLVNLCKTIIDLKKLKKDAKRVLDNEIANSHELITEYNKWKRTYRLNTVVLSAFLANQLCKLEERGFDYKRRKRAYVGASTACISDDIIDKGAIKDSRKVRLLTSTPEPLEDFRLFYSFNSCLVKLLPNDFTKRFKKLIEKYNYVQEKARTLTKNLNPKEVLEIKNNTGGFPLILLHRIMFPEKKDLPNDFHPNYDSIKETLPLSKDEAIFNYGVMISRIDDLNDLEWDIEEGRKSLATERLVTWKTLKIDVNYVGKGFRKFYSKSNVDKIMSVYSPLMMHFASDIVNFRARMEK